ncbi:hypothetical protein [Amycolatopsis sp. NPDC004378]
MLSFHTSHLERVAFSGLDLFFALSVYLITDLLLRRSKLLGLVSCRRGVRRSTTERPNATLTRWHSLVATQIRDGLPQRAARVAQHGNLPAIAESGQPALQCLRGLLSPAV